MKKVLSSPKVLWILVVVLVVTIIWLIYSYTQLSNSIPRITSPEGLERLKVANDLYNKGEYQKAREKFVRLTRVSASHIKLEAWYKWGMCEYRLKNYRSARSSFRIYLDLCRQYEESPRLQAQFYIAESFLEQENKDYAQAYLAFDRITTEEFRYNQDLQAQAMYKAAYSLKQLKVYDEALGRYAEFLVRFPNSKYISHAYLDRGAIYINKKDYELARSNYDRALKSTDNLNVKAESQFQIGHTYYTQGDFQKARTAFNVLLQQEYSQSKQVAIARRLIARTHRNEEEWNKAIDAYNSIIKNHAKVEDTIRIQMDGYPISVNLIASIYYGIGYAFDKKKDFKAAFKSYARITTKPEGDEKDFRVDPIAPFALYNAMVALNGLWDIGESGIEVKSELREALNVLPEEPLETKIEKVLDRFANKYISYLAKRRDSLNDDAKLVENDLLSAEARFRFAEILRNPLEEYDKAATEYARLQDYSPIPQPRLDFIKLKGKYYEGLCYSELSLSKKVEADEAKENKSKADEAYQEAITLFNTIFCPLIDIPNIDVPATDKEVFDFCIQTALEYAEKACAKIKDTEYAKKACPKIKEARQKLEDKDKEMDKSDASANPAAPEQSQTKGQLTSEQIAQKASGSTVFLHMDNVGTGSGFFVKPGQIATNYHVIKGAVRGTARLVGTNKIYAIVGYTAIDAKRDLVILKVRAFGVDPLVLGGSDNIKINDDIYAVGNPLGRSYLEGTVSYGKISGLREDPTRKWIQITAPITHGNSGGPVLNSKAEVIGVSTQITLDNEYFLEYKVKDSKGQEIGSVKLPRRREQNLNFAVHVDELKALLNLIGPPKPLSTLEIID